MEITVNRNGHAAVVSIKGEMNIYNALEGKELLVKALENAGDLEIDLSGVTEFDSSGLQLLLLAFREAERNGNRARVSAKSGPVEAVTGLFRLDGFFGVQEA